MAFMRSPVRSRSGPPTFARLPSHRVWVVLVLFGNGHADRAIDDHLWTSAHAAANALQRVGEVCLVENGKTAGRFGDRTQAVQHSGAIAGP